MVDDQRQDIELLGTLVQGILGKERGDVRFQSQNIHVGDIDPRVLLLEMTD